MSLGSRENWQILRWLAAFAAAPTTVWFAVVLLFNSEGKSFSNLTGESCMVASGSVVIFLAWWLLSKGRLALLVGIILLLSVSAAALLMAFKIPAWPA